MTALHGRFGLQLAAALAIVLAAPAVAQQASAPGPIEAMKAGDSFWAPDVAPEGPVTILISLPLQRAYVYRNGVPIGISTVSTGKAGHETPTGIFTILEKRITHHSSKYDNAPMPYMERLTWDGVALHAGPLPGHAASHGCIRLPLDFARNLFGITHTRATTVIITDEAVMPEVSPSSAPGLDEAAAQDGNSQDYVWTPGRAPTGPVSIVVSGRDRRIVIMRNGRQIGAGRVTLDAPIAVTSAYVLRGLDSGGPHWLRLPLPPDTHFGATELTMEERARGHVPEGLRRAIEGILQPGATLLVTRDTLASSGTGMRLRVMEGPH